MNNLPMYKELKYVSENDNSNKIFSECISIPSSSNLTVTQQKKVISEIKNFFQLMILPNITYFIKKYITKREISLFSNDLENHKQKLFSEINSKSILVIGGAGTIGSSFIKAALRYGPSKLTVVDKDENGSTELTRTLRSNINIKVPDYYITYPISFSSEVFYKMIKRHGKFDIVANFAAHKHVRSEKDGFSIEAMIKNNVISAKKFLDYLVINKPSHFFCVSTDKAANPVNVMGASKKLMENVIMSYSKEIKITTARFANVAFSNGSLLYGYINRLIQDNQFRVQLISSVFLYPQKKVVKSAY